MSEAPQQIRSMVARAMRHQLRIPLRFRPLGHREWSAGETVNISESGILFATDRMLEVDTAVEITFQTSGNPMLRSSTRNVYVVRRSLSNWPDTGVLFGARFSA